MAARTWILLGLALAVPLGACQSVDVKLAKPRYATRIEDVLPGNEGPGDRGARPAAAPTPASSADPVVRREAIDTDDLAPISNSGQPEGRGLDTPRRALDTRAEPAAPPATGNFRYTVQPGDTVAGVGRRFGVRAQAIIELNSLEPRGGVRAGQALTLPGSARDKGSDPYATGPAPAGMQRTADYADASPPPSSTAPRASAAPATPASSDPARGRGRFIWPVRGDILSRYGAMGTGLRNDGVNIAAPEGTAVKAAAGGEVVYAGSVIAAFGNMVLIKHADGWVTAYGHLARIDVKMRDTVTQGQVIGAVGSSGGAPTPQLHFEIRFAPSAREKAAPVDPLPILR